MHLKLICIIAHLKKQSKPQTSSLKMGQVFSYLNPQSVKVGVTNFLYFILWPVLMMELVM